MERETEEKETSCHCHKCGQALTLDDRVCSSCGVMTHIICPYCGTDTFIQSNCRNCRNSLFVACQKKGCGAVQLISHLHLCKACGADMELELDKDEVQKLQKP
ncbi:MAG: hypothetical protein FWG88_08895 [Oscillospiraceae bacterium]|nr:hypothetical protein [Oscillospiraceae bacterium]